MQLLVRSQRTMWTSDPNECGTREMPALCKKDHFCGVEVTLDGKHHPESLWKHSHLGNLQLIRAECAQRQQYEQVRGYLTWTVRQLDQGLPQQSRHLMNCSILRSVPQAFQLQRNCVQAETRTPHYSEAWPGFDTVPKVRLLYCSHVQHHGIGQ